MDIERILARETLGTILRERKVCSHRKMVRHLRCENRRFWQEIAR